MVVNLFTSFMKNLNVVSENIDARQYAHIELYIRCVILRE